MPSTELRLPVESQAKLLETVKELPPGSPTVREALAKREIDPGQSIEHDVLKATRLALWALLYYPGQTISYQAFLSWKNGRIVQPGSTEIALFRKHNNKLREQIKKLGMPCVGWLTERETVKNPQKVDGFRLTTSGDDYANSLLPQNKKRLKNASVRFTSDLDPTCIPLDSIEDPMLKRQVRHDQEIVKKFDKSGVMQFFTDSKSTSNLLSR
jgi:hypothetical protein